MPAHSSAVPDLTTLATLLVPPVGSTTTVESSAPPKPVRAYVSELESKVIVFQLHHLAADGIVGLLAEAEAVLAL